MSASDSEIEVEVFERTLNGRLYYWDPETDTHYDPKTGNEVPCPPGWEPGKPGNLTVECPCCFEHVQWEKMTVCSNGHPGGCQKCHMKLVKSTYESGKSAYIGGTTNCQKCFVCRNQLCDTRMGRGWTRLLRNVQTLMVLKMKEAQGMPPLDADLRAQVVATAQQRCQAENLVTESDDCWYDAAKATLALYPPSAHKVCYDILMKTAFKGELGPGRVDSALAAAQLNYTPPGLTLHYQE